MAEPKMCASCGELFTPMRADARTCSDRCRQRLRRGVVVRVARVAGKIDGELLRTSDPDALDFGEAWRIPTDAELAELAKQEVERKEAAKQRRAERRALAPEVRAAIDAADKMLGRLDDLRLWVSQVAEIDAATMLANLPPTEARVEQMRESLDVSVERLRDVQQRLGQS
jgi:hypothetical protein